MKLNKSTIYPIILLIAMFAVHQYRQSKHENLIKDLVVLQGHTMGTTYDVRYFDAEKRDFQQQIDSVLEAYNQLFSTYINSSELSRINQLDTAIISPVFVKILQCAKRIHQASEGYYDVTVFPLVKRWGFAGTQQITAPNAEEIDSLLHITGFYKVHFTDSLLIKPKAIQLDFSSIAKGMAVDAVSDFLLEKNIQNHKVDVGGELVCKGEKPNGEAWIIGIARPERFSNEAIQKIPLRNQALATSGNYRNIRIYNHQEYGHTLNPKTGLPEKNELLSVSIFSNNCMTADAFATACLASGLQKSIKMVEQNTDIEAYIIYSEQGVEKEYFSLSLKKQVEQ